MRFQEEDQINRLLPPHLPGLILLPFFQRNHVLHDVFSVISGLISSALGQIQQSSSPAGESLTTASLAAILSSTDADGIGPSGSDGSSSGGGTTTEAQTIIDVQEGDRVKLECRFSAELAQKASTLYWIRTNRNGHDNVAIGETPYQAKYR